MNTNTDPVRALLDAAAAYLDGEYHDSDVEAHYNYQHRRRSERERLRAAINALASAPPSAPAGVEEMAGLLEQIRDLLASLPTDCLGIDTDASGQTYPIRDEVIHGIAKALAQQPAASAPVVDEAAATLAFEEHINGSADDPYFEGELELWLAAWRAALTHKPAAPTLAKHQPCGCVICTCEDEQQCQGCGAKHCGNRADHPPYVAQQPAAPSGEAVAPAEDIIERLEAERDRCDNLAASTGNSLTREREARLANYFDCAVREIRRLAALAAQQQGGAK